jgi:2-keto-4-pentenoate hydratase/2-oxohepta-3-ene-1,7-dioic acid hydratase in catechol pathway
VNLQLLCGESCRNVPEEMRTTSLRPYCLNDVTARDLQKTTPFCSRSKSFDTSAP